MKIEFTIKEYREFLKINQAVMSEKLGITQAAYSKIESSINTTKNERYAVIANALNLDIEHVKNNKVEIYFFVCRDISKCTELEKLHYAEILKSVVQNIESSKKIYDKY